MKIYEVSGHDKGLSHFYEPSKDAANRRKREMKKESYANVEIRVIDVAPTRAGIAKAMNDLINILCANEH